MVAIFQHLSGALADLNLGFEGDTQQIPQWAVENSDGMGHLKTEFPESPSCDSLVDVLVCPNISPCLFSFGELCLPISCSPGN